LGDVDHRDDHDPGLPLRISRHVVPNEVHEALSLVELCPDHAWPPPWSGWSRPPGHHSTGGRSPPTQAPDQGERGYPRSSSVWPATAAPSTPTVGSHAVGMPPDRGTPKITLRLAPATWAR